MDVLGHYNYWISIALMMLGLYGVIAKKNLVKKVIALGIFQTAIFLFFISIGNVEGGTAPVRREGFEVYSNPLPHALILTAIVVSVSTTAVALALVVGIKRAYRTIEAPDIEEADRA